MPLKVLSAIPLQPEAEAALAAFCEYEAWDPAEPITEEALIARLADKDGLLLDGGPKVSRRLLEHCPRLKAVSDVSVGYNNFDLAAMKERGVIGTHTPGVLDESVADLALGLMIASARRICELDRTVRAGGWPAGSDLPLRGGDVNHRTVGIIGMGRIGEAVAQRARLGFNMDVVYHNRRRKLETELSLGVHYRSLPDLLRESDFVVMITPYTPETHQMMGAEQFALMKPSAYFINVSRGRNVDEPALVRALQDGVIAGAGLDVFTVEPLAADSPLTALENVVLTPHIGTNTGRTRLDMSLLGIRNLKAALTGGQPPAVVPELR